MASIKLIKNTMRCKECNYLMNLTVDNKSLDGYIWLCSLSHRKKQINVRKFSFFNNIRKSFKQVFLFIYFWCEQKDRTRIGTELSLSKNTISLWCLYLRELCRIAFFDCSNFKLGGLDENGNPKIVEIDESMFFRRKYNVGRCKSSGWVFGFIRLFPSDFELFFTNSEEYLKERIKRLEDYETGIRNTNERRLEAQSKKNKMLNISDDVPEGTLVLIREDVNLR